MRLEAVFEVAHVRRRRMRSAGAASSCTGLWLTLYSDSEHLTSPFLLGQLEAAEFESRIVFKASWYESATTGSPLLLL